MCCARALSYPVCEKFGCEGLTHRGSARPNNDYHQGEFDLECHLAFPFVFIFIFAGDQSNGKENG
jgi:hypothetical protein